MLDGGKRARKTAPGVGTIPPRGNKSGPFRKATDRDLLLHKTFCSLQTALSARLMWRSGHIASFHLKAQIQSLSLPAFPNRSRLLHRPIDRRRPVANHRQFGTYIKDESAYANPYVPALSDAQRRTIYALSTPPGKAGVAVVRISGPDALLVWKRMVRIHGGKHKRHLPEPWKMERCRITQPEEGGEALDDGLAVYFRGL